MKGKYLITTDNWFYVPDGRSYRAAWGNVEILDDSVLGVKTNRNSVNWFAKVGNEDKHVIIAGCQVNYSVRCEERPNTDFAQDWNTDNNGFKVFERPCAIYIAE